MTIYTQAMRDAARAIVAEPLPHPYWPSSDEDVRSRAREFANHPVGSVLQPHQLDYLEAFRQRLDTYIGGSHEPRPSHVAFAEAMQHDA
ncbi:hypothetical protein UFOVP4_27 [uncultured Caudovirales phage]|uniref:Uncharacterized protein n=1 Tax=uncultured Caudovirales phage TaxID=2100421 RepID=A0A6J5T9Q1_9CAUD|nr:hypothetical protein UFOVP4_27 [uncultured Caudovirales phage]CAB4241291.1 hypothetical protein UFOVP64_33 [uncultured Caudovirales phage]CAB5079006.1 hypothetical protein UFOVP145_47 [uncultured Caudovirales phage]